MVHSFLVFSHQRTCEMQLISWKKNNPLKKTQRGHNSPEKKHINPLTDSILSSQRVRALSPETTVTETRAFEAAISEISFNVDLTTPY